MPPYVITTHDNKLFNSSVFHIANANFRALAERLSQLSCITHINIIL